MGVAFPAIILTANYIGLRRGDDDALRLAQRWSKVAVLFAVGAITGTVLSFEMGLLWPEFMSRFGRSSARLRVEGIFFFVEAIFIAIYIFGWKRLGWRTSGRESRSYRGPRRRPLRGRGQLVDEHPRRVQGGQGRRPDGRGSGGRVLQQGARVRGASHDPRGTWSPDSSWLPSMRWACCAGGATATIASVF